MKTVRTHWAPPLAALLALLMMIAAGCGGDEAGTRTASPSVIASLDGATELRRVLDEAGDRLVVVDFYADWCRPCRQLSPMLEEIARKHPEKAAFYKIDVDRHQALARAYRVTGIPHVAFIRSHETVHRIIGVQHRDAYIRALGRYASLTGG